MNSDIIFHISQHLTLINKLKLQAVSRATLQSTAWTASELNQRLLRACNGTHGTATLERLLADPRVDPSARNNAAIRRAASHGHLLVVDRLLQDPRVDPSGNYKSPLQLAAKNDMLMLSIVSFKTRASTLRPLRIMP
ncbi:hypothetical protein HDU90_005260 [Geranomyces variabilis]|nr:hypothetical protein HDU90_005260 [Geranomyces variabilis]